MRTLDRRALNRATLARQFLLERSDRSPLEAVRHLVGLQAQAPLAPYVALWSRLVDFRPQTLAEAVADGRATRVTVMRATIHLVTADDAVALRPLLQSMLERRFFTSPFARNLAGVDLTEVQARGRELLADGPLTRPQLSKGLQRWWPDRDAASLAYAVTFQVPLMHVPPRGVWGRTGPVAYSPYQIGDSTVDIDAVVRRYLGAFGPASVRDAQAWCGLTRLAEVMRRLTDLETFRDEHGVELYDLPDAPRPDPDTPAPPRFLPEYDNVLLSHADRSRVNPDGHPVPLLPGNGAAAGTVLIDGAFRATWRLDRDRATVQIAPMDRLTRAERSELTREAYALARLVLDGPGRVEFSKDPNG
jgi:Winged helix DNA-binding domain